jgi:NAD-dependent deacetylase
LNCKKEYEMDEIIKILEIQLPPTCRCGGILKPKTILFGESLPHEALEQANIAAKNCDLFLVVGSSLVVYPAAALPEIAKSSNASLVIINIDPTPLDVISDLVIREKASKVFAKIID